MTKQGAERAVVISAMVVFGVYFYRIVTEGQSKQQGGVAQLIGIGAPANIGRFVTGWGFAYLVIAIITEATPGFGGALAILVAVGDFLTNAGDLITQVQGQLAKPYKPSPPATTGTGVSNIGSAVKGAVPQTGPGVSGIGSAAGSGAGGQGRTVPPLGGIGHRNIP